jgi:hypothetical protein
MCRDICAWRTSRNGNIEDATREVIKSFRILNEPFSSDASEARRESQE